jgi:hypothetical protein
MNLKLRVTCVETRIPSTLREKRQCVWFGVVYLFIQSCNIGHVNYRLQFIYYNRTYNIWISTQYNMINNYTKFKNQLGVESVTTYRNMCIYINIPKS